MGSMLYYIDQPRTSSFPIGFVKTELLDQLRLT